MRKFFSVVMTAVLIFCLFSCNFIPGGSQSSGKEYDGTVIKSGEKLYMIKSSSAESYESILYNELASMATGMGADVYKNSDTSTQQGAEIAIGNTTRQASVDALALMNKNHKSGNVAYALVYKDGTLAIVGADEYSIGQAAEYLLATYVTDGCLKVPNDLSHSINMTTDEYEVYLRELELEQQLAGWENRFEVYEETLGADGAAALKSLCDLFGEDIYMWIANLWDPDTGAFYYSSSARDYSAFKPDVESTCQALKVIGQSGMLNYYGDGMDAWEDAMPEDIQKKITDFVLSLYCHDDGYFYHSQWGSDITDDRKGRDLEWSVQILGFFNEDMPEGWYTAIDRLQGNGSVQSAVSRLMKSRVVAVASDNRFSSRENFIAYLDSLNIPSNPYSKGHQLASQQAQIKAAGLIDVCCDYLDALQEEVYENQIANGETPSGVWSSDVSYSSVSGFFKIAVIYSSAGRSQKYLSHVVDTCMECILSDEPTNQIVYVYNPWAAIGEAFSGMQRANKAAEKQGKPAVYDMEKEYAKVRSKAYELISITANKTAEYIQPDHGLSYNTSGSASRIQGVYASLGFAEGDLNGTTLVTTYMINYMCNALGVERPDIWNARDFEKFMSELQSKTSIIKIQTPSVFFADFSDYTVGETPSSKDAIIDSGTANTEIVQDPEDSDNMVLSMYSPASHADGFKVNCGLSNATQCFSFEAKLNMQSRTASTTHQISFYTANRSYMIALKGSTTNVAVYEDSSVKGTTNKSLPTGINFPVGEWFTLNVELYSVMDRTGEMQFYAKYYVNGKCVYIGQNYYNETGTAEIPDVSGVTNIWFYSLISPESELLIDDIKVEYLDKEFSTDDDSSLTPTGKVNYDFENGIGKITEKITSEGGVGNVLKVTGPNGRTSAYNFMKIETNAWDQLTIPMPRDVDDSDKLVYEMDVKFSSFSGNAQLAIGGLDANSSYLLIFKSTSNGFTLADSTSISGGKVTSYDSTYLLNKWYNIRIEMTVTDKASAFETKIYIDNKLVVTSKNYYNYTGTATAPTMKLDVVNLRFVSATKVDIYLDNISISYK